MAITWISSPLKELPVQWMTFETVIVPDANKELLQVKFGMRSDYPAGPVYFDQLALYRNLTNERLLANYVVYIPVPAGTVRVPVFGAVVNSYLVAAHIVPKLGITGEDPALQLQIFNAATEQVICTKTFIEGSNANANELVNFGGTDESTRELTAGESAYLEVVGAFPDLLLVLQWNVL